MDALKRPSLHTCFDVRKKNFNYNEWKTRFSVELIEPLSLSRACDLGQVTYPTLSGEAVLTKGSPNWWHMGGFCFGQELSHGGDEVSRENTAIS